ncbi:hypothetical protein BOTBODRAFT_432521 [Botryobasidium botryosum FD-172 SS1]|uniref:Uncharacterized protein n=1 Tax=Botryobasidium botryosum (strain FD-172 SS1) TaxID=930990 RepID=A0A067M844_BOTB1|nr:hypothetical protein BOTBODRAFT_432521 [Botryobasidium botryosum FD-172 SS1]
MRVRVRVRSMIINISTCLHTIGPNRVKRQKIPKWVEKKIPKWDEGKGSRINGSKAKDPEMGRKQRIPNWVEEKKKEKKNKTKTKSRQKNTMIPARSKKVSKNIKGLILIVT